ncbi:EAL domain-containing protein [Pseudoalteromonas sp. SWXJ133]|uniref:sensor domain-containing phosphodiesterase n=1 Tax=unclassified Pseudoalteromonas TaxID=194690 RepID=UPI001408AC7E|nr:MULTISPECIES: EAL domain-containing protein [unclassified Pseudoalteromonas]MBH0020124.1 EAL domain-containing protein [Pseudoalteromonas sp. SWXJ133]
MGTDRLKKLLSHQQGILSKIALGVPLNEVLTEICLSIEQIIDDESARCSILSVKGQQLFHCAAPNIHPEYCSLLNGVHIGPKVGSCGTAAFSRSRTIVENIETSPLWEEFKDLALKFDLKSCWSTPIFSTQADLLGTFAIYHSTPKAPSEQDLELIDFFVHFSSIALEKSNEFEKTKQLVVNLQHSNEKFKAFTKVMPDLILILSEDGVYTDIYGTSNELLLDSTTDLIGGNVQDLLPQKDAQMIMDVIEKTLSTNEMQIFEYELNVPKGSIVFEGRAAALDHYHPNNPTKRHIVWMARDISIRKKAEQEVHKLAFYDPLTSLPNRRMLSDRLSICVENVKCTKNIGALLFLDLDNFKRINDSLGHSAGDEVLVELSKRLSEIIKGSDTLARAGGDEFIILLKCVGQNTQQASLECKSVTKEIQKAFHDKFEVGKLAFQVSCSIGICLIDSVNTQAGNILKFADTAMYRSKKKGGNSSSFYDPALQTLLEKQTELETDIVRAIASNEFCAYFQPQMNTQGDVVGAEALIRWNHPQRGLITANEFIPIAEQYGLIQKLQNIVLHDICILINELKVSTIIDDSFSVSINISQSQFNSSNLKGELFNTINKFDIRASQIKLEITESMLSSDIDYTIRQMKELIAAGFLFSIDDFGTGYSCLAYLSALPVKELKIDKNFIDKILDNGIGFNIAQTIISLGKSLNLAVVAEGVETAEQYDLLKKMNIDTMQGYLVAKPMDKERYLKWHSAKTNLQ